MDGWKMCRDRDRQDREEFVYLDFDGMMQTDGWSDAHLEGREWVPVLWPE